MVYVEGDFLDEKWFYFAVSASFIGSMIGKSANTTVNSGEMVLFVC